MSEHRCRFKGCTEPGMICDVPAAKQRRFRRFGFRLWIHVFDRWIGIP